jgi:hypothetical protein
MTDKQSKNKAGPSASPQDDTGLTEISLLEIVLRLSLRSGVSRG